MCGTDCWFPNVLINTTVVIFRINDFWWGGGGGGALVIDLAAIGELEVKPQQDETDIWAAIKWKQLFGS
jgi:hypothetical protein